MGTNSTPLVSILIANYNNGCYLQEAIDSVFTQNYNNWEIIIVDDKSPDESFVIYDKYKEDYRFYVHFNDVNRGVGYTKRRCVDMAHGDICIFLDPDDVLLGDDVLDVMVKAHIAYPNASMIYSGMYRGDENLNIMRESPGQDIHPSPSALHTRSWPFHPVIAFKKSSYLKTEGIDPFMRNAEDYDLYYKLEEVGEVIHLDLLQYIQRNNPHSISVYDDNDVLLKNYVAPSQISGYEYEFLESAASIAQGKLQSDSMPLDESIYMMEIMDKIRYSWGLKYPGEG